MTDDDSTPPIDAAEAFDVLGDEVRVGILRALIEGEGVSLPFSALRDAVGVTDSGRFNYHLQRLAGHFVERRDDGYVLRYPGRKVAHAVLAGTFNERAHMDPTDVEGECHACGAEALVAAYGGERLSIRCGDCGERLVEVPFPPSAVSSRDPGAVVDAFDRWSTNQARLASGGVCPECGGEMDGAVREDVPDGFDHDALVTFECSVCRRRATMTFGAAALHHPAVQAFHHRRREFPRERPYWTVPQLVTDRHTEVVSTDPWRVRVSFPVGDGTLDAVVDGNAAVVEVTER